MTSEDPIYLDFNATTPIDPDTVEAMLPYLRSHFGNPSSGHVYGHRAREAVEHARAQVAVLVGADPEEIIFTGSGTEANNMAIRLNGHPEQRLPNTLNVSFPGVRGSAGLEAAPNIAASTGSACHAGEEAPSSVLAAMGCDSKRAWGRFGCRSAGPPRRRRSMSPRRSL